MRFFYRLKRAGLVPMDAILDHYEVTDRSYITGETYFRDMLIVCYRIAGEFHALALSDSSLNNLTIRMIENG